jgi:hypothetical protein
VDTSRKRQIIEPECCRFMLTNHPEVRVKVLGSGPNADISSPTPQWSMNKLNRRLPPVYGEEC